ncbi:hypothetical protein [Desulforamulus putei]|uniref:Uncharacterized protein n=1 Tax=Desulforamulus putei DSM 12395 TaxID=1121429 RepID=A0A1M4SGH6_9FIRM|nr:hypothetical protein [Desulforamulus putei]SHE31300.1 hypothetical protein SAMN02745133_00112 [Desulforamulus putei DSM 12395]
MKVNFIHTDEYMDYVHSQQEIHDLADFLLSEPEFLPEVAAAVLKSYKLGEFEKWRMSYLNLNNLAKAKAKRAKQERFATMLKKVFDLALTPPEGESEEQFLKKLRGGILEVLVSRFLVERYCCLSSNCLVCVDGQVLKAKPEDTAGKTMDVAGVDKLADTQIGEWYECKVSSRFTSEKTIAFIQQTRQLLASKGAKDLLVSLVSFENKTLWSSLFKKYGYAEQKMIGQNELASLISYDKVKRVLI